MNSRDSNKKFVIYSPGLDLKSGGIIILHNLAKDLNDLGQKAMLLPLNGSQYENIFCNQFATLEDIDDSTVVIYPEIVEGNPLKAKCVVRWMLCDLGVWVNSDIYKTWGANDLIFHYATFNKRYDERLVDILYSLWIDPRVQNKNLPRSGSCYLYKKAFSFHKKIYFKHPMDAVMIDTCSFEEIIEIFNTKEYFYCYDPYTYYDVIAALCGCIPIVYPIEDVTKSDWVKSRISHLSPLENSNNISGIAYGPGEISYAQSTQVNVRREQQALIEYGKSTVSNFIKKVDAYFFNGNNSCNFNTVEKVATDFGWGLNQEEGLRHIIKKQDQEIENLNQLISQKNFEIGFMKGSRFWKLRNFVKKYI